jgi:hypothetical protein
LMQKTGLFLNSPLPIPWGPEMISYFTNTQLKFPFCEKSLWWPWKGPFLNISHIIPLSSWIKQWIPINICSFPLFNFPAVTIN